MMMPHNQIKRVVSCFLLSGPKTRDQLRIVVFHRVATMPTFPNHWAACSGSMEENERPWQTSERELREETGVEAGKLKLVGVYSDPKRDPRGHVCSVAFMTRIDHATPLAGDDAAEAEWVADAEEQLLAFDHDHILRDALQLG